ncbi:MAG: hypothetical protein WA459_16220 [Stellaceae bacterium]
MMFIIRSSGARPDSAGIQIKLSRATPAIVPDATGKTDFFCVGEADAMAALHASGWTLVELHDGYYEDGLGGGVGIWGQGRYWEIRDTPFTIKEAVGPTPPGEAGSPVGEEVNVRGAIFGV